MKITSALVATTAMIAVLVGCGADVEDGADSNDNPSATSAAALKIAADPGGGGATTTSGGILRPPTSCEAGCKAAGHLNEGWCTEYCTCRELFKKSVHECEIHASMFKIDL